jgi:hypothetical protein
MRIYVLVIRCDHLSFSWKHLGARRNHDLHARDLIVLCAFAGLRPVGPKSAIA